MSPQAGEYRSAVGLKDLYYALVTQDDELGYVTETPAKLAPVATAKATPSTASETQYMDDQAYDNVSAEGETKLEIEISNLPESIRARLSGEVFDEASGRTFDNADPSGAPYFALGYRFKKSNGKYRYRWYNKCRLEKPTEENATQADKPTLKTSTLNITAIKTIYQFDLRGDGSLMDGNKRVGGDEDTDNFSATGWFSAVQVPTVPAHSALALSSSTPAHAATGVAVSANVVLVFNNALAQGAEEHVTIVDETFGQVLTAATFSEDRKTLTLNPSSNLSSATTYGVIFNAVPDVFGQTLTDFISFTTA